MGRFSGFSSLSTRLMLKLSQFPGLGFLAGYVESAKVLKLQFGDQVGDYEVYLDLAKGIGSDVTGATGTPRSGRAGSAGGEEEEGEGFVYDDYEFDENDLSSPGYHPADDYPISDDRHSYFDDDYRAH